MVRAVPRGVRNNNPGNIRRTKNDRWVGMAPVQSDPDFVCFTAPEFGIRAMALVLQAYQDRHGLQTIRQLIERWAPRAENPTKAYAAHVAKAVGVGLDEPIDVRDYAIARPMIEAMIAFENGGYRYPPRAIDEGLRRAGVVRPKPLSPHEVLATDTVKGGGVALAGTGLSSVLAAVLPHLTGLDWRVAVTAIVVVVLSAFVGLLVWRFGRE